MEWVRVGHWTDQAARTGCTVVLLPAGSVASGEIRGGAPATREWALLSPERTISHVDAVVLSGGSAFGLAACDGVLRYCAEQSMGVPTGAGPVPIVVGACIYDLATGDSSIRPGADQGYAAATAAGVGAADPGSMGVSLGAVGGGCGATVNKWLGSGGVRPGGIGSASQWAGSLVVSALVVVNAVGDLIERARLDPIPEVWPEAGSLALGDPNPSGAPSGAPSGLGGNDNPNYLDIGGMNTTIGVIATNAILTKGDCLLVAQSGHDGMARALEPVHTSLDGDALVAVATGAVQAPLEQVRLLGARSVEAAIRSVLA
ncbi:MAG: P1 family peptidase [Acidimicrobiales bacterium]